MHIIQVDTIIIIIIIIIVSYPIKVVDRPQRPWRRRLPENLNNRQTNSPATLTSQERPLVLITVRV